MIIVLLSSDLMMVSAAQGAAQLASGSVAAIAAPDDAVAKVEELAAAVLVIDLRLPGLAVEQVVNQVRNLTKPPRIIACGPHVHAQRLAAAREAGCDEVITRGEFEGRITDILATTKN